MESKRDGGYCYFQAVSRSHFFTTSVPHSLVQPRTYQFYRKISHSLTQFSTQKYLHQIPSFIQFTLPHSATLHSLFHSLIQKYIHSHFFIQPLLRTIRSTTLLLYALNRYSFCRTFTLIFIQLYLHSSTLNPFLHWSLPQCCLLPLDDVPSHSLLH
jgi:hypothetical protein